MNIPLAICLVSVSYLCGYALGYKQGQAAGYQIRLREEIHRNETITARTGGK